MTDRNKTRWEIVTEHRVTQTHKRFSADPYYSYMTNENILGTSICGTFPFEQLALKAAVSAMKEYLKSGFEKTSELILTKPGDGDDILSDEIRFNLEEVVVSKKRLIGGKRNG